jgi:hypothetical protein
MKPPVARELPEERAEPQAEGHFVFERRAWLDEGQWIFAERVGRMEAGQAVVTAARWALSPSDARLAQRFLLFAEDDVRYYRMLSAGGLERE